MLHSQAYLTLQDPFILQHVAIVHCLITKKNCAPYGDATIYLLSLLMDIFVISVWGDCYKEHLQVSLYMDLGFHFSSLSIQGWNGQMLTSSEILKQYSSISRLPVAFYIPTQHYVRLQFSHVFNMCLFGQSFSFIIIVKIMCACEGVQPHVSECSRGQKCQRSLLTGVTGSCQLSNVVSRNSGPLQEQYVLLTT